MSVHRAQSGKWLVRYRDAGRNRSKTFSLKADADRFDADVRRRRELGELILSRRDVPTLREEATDWLAGKTDLSPVTEAHYANLLRLHILPQLGAVRLVDLRPRLLDQWQRGLMGKGGGTRTVQQARMVLSQILTRAVAHEYLQANPLSAISAPRHRAREVEPATVEQVEAMRGYFLDRNDRTGAALISVLAYVGLRPPQESHGLMWSDLEGGTLRVRRRNVYGRIERGLKANKRERVVKLPGPVAAELAELRLRLGRATGIIFARSDGGPLNKSDWGNYSRRGFARARASAGLSGAFTPYDLRHTCASLMIAAGRPPTEVANRLGHSVAQSVNTYQHLIEAMEGQEIVPFDELIRRERECSLNVPRKEG